MYASTNPPTIDSNFGQPINSTKREKIPYICDLRTRIECEREGEHSTRK